LGDPQRAAQAAIEELHDRAGGVGGVILLSPDGRPGWHYNTPYMPRALMTAGMAEPLVEL
jgi:isoaspartyl peptidase/L-asparaginase-like protein (Ntn-hydrolase superfamily)